MSLDSLYKCNNAVHSRFCANSNELVNSSFIFCSTKITNCTDVMRSKHCRDSSLVFDSSFVTSSQKIVESKTISDSINIVSSSDLFNCKNIYRSVNIEDSSECEFCSGLAASHFCNSCVDSSNLLFCYGVRDSSYQLFNKPISERILNNYLQTYNDFITELNLVKEFPEGNLSETHLQIVPNFQVHFQGISNDFYEWAKSLKGYDPRIMYNITMNESLLAN